MKIQATVLNRYGVVNIGQLDNYGRKRFNAIPYTKLKLVEEIKEFRRLVDIITQQKVQQLKKQKKLLTTCNYTGIPFIDEIKLEVNPNDPLKRTVDHVVPVTEAFFLGWTPEQTAADTNIVFCLRIVNTLKHNTDAEKFKKMYVPLLKERLIYESQRS